MRHCLLFYYLLRQSWSIADFISDAYSRIRTTPILTLLMDWLTFRMMAAPIKQESKSVYKSLHTRPLWLPSDRSTESGFSRPTAVRKVLWFTAPPNQPVCRPNESCVAALRTKRVCPSIHRPNKNGGCPRVFNAYLEYSALHLFNGDAWIVIA